MTQHYKIICEKCEDVIEQCRCPSHDKSITYKTCNKCKDTKEAVKYVYADPDNGAREAQEQLKRHVCALIQREDILLLNVDFIDLDTNPKELHIKYAEIEN